MGVKKSVVATIACSSFNRYTAASSLDSIPTSRSFGSPRIGVLARISESTAGAILQPQPPPWENCVRRMRSAGGVMGRIGGGNEKLENRYGSTHPHLLRGDSRAPPPPNPPPLFAR